MSSLTNNEDLDGLTILGKDAAPAKKLEVFPNHDRDRDYAVTLRTGEFTCLCPMTGQPDFASLTITYIPDASILESKSLKLYLWSFRNEGAFHEHVTNTILEDLVKAMEPRWCTVSAVFAGRGGIGITVDVEYIKAGFSVPQRIASRNDGKKVEKTGYQEKQGAEGRQFHSPPARWDRERDRNRPDQKWDRNNEKRRPFPAEQKTDAPPKRSERKTTKSLGVTRTWRKRM